MKKILKKIGLSLAAVACVACAGVGVSLSSSKSAPEAKAATIEASDFWVSSTGLRLVNDANGAGLRFHTNITLDAHSTVEESGTLIIPEVLYDGQLTLDDYLNNDNEATRPTRVVTKGKNDNGAWVDLWYSHTHTNSDGSEEDVMRSTVYLYDVPESMYGVRMVAVSYVKAYGEDTYTYTNASPATSMADVANKIGESSQYYDQAQPFKVGDVTVTYNMPDGSKQPKEVAYGSKLNGPTYDKDAYVIQSATDKWGRDVVFGSYEATLPTTIDVELGMKKPQIAESAVIGGSSAKNLEKQTNDMAAPTGFNNVTKLFSANGNTWSSKIMQSGDYAQADITGYSEVWYAIKVINGHFTDTTGGWKNIDSDSTSPWVMFHLIQEDAGTWTMEIYKDNVLWGTHEAQNGTTVGQVMDKSDDGHRICLYQQADSNNQSPTYNQSNADTTVYATEVVGVPKLQAVPTYGSVVVLDSTTGTPDTVLSGYTTLDSVPDSIITPAGFETVMGFEKTLAANANDNSFKGIQIGAYKELWFAMKVVGGKVTTVLNYNGTVDWYADYGTDANGWVYFHLTQHDETVGGMAVWTIELIGSKTLVLDDQQPLQYNTLGKLLQDTPARDTSDNTSPFGDDDDTFYLRKDGTAGTLTVYTTEIRGVLKNGATAPDTGDTDTTFDPEIPDNVTVARRHIWGDSLSKYSDETITISSDGAPEGFTTVLKDVWNTTQTGIATWNWDATVDITRYSDLYLAIKEENDSDGINIGGEMKYDGGAWMYIHYTQTSTGTWSGTFKAADGTFDKSRTGLVGSDLKTLLTKMYYASTAGVGTTYYFTEVLGIPVSNDAWAERVVDSAIDGAVVSKFTTAKPNGFIKAWEKANFTANDFAAIDVSAYETLRFGLLTSGNLNIKMTDANKAQFMAESPKTVSGVAHTYASIAYANIRMLSNNIGGMYTVDLVNNGDGNWTVTINTTVHYDPTCNTSTGCAELGTQNVASYSTTVTNATTLQKIMAEVFTPATGMTIYCTEVRGTHTCATNNTKSAGDGYVQDFCACGKPMGDRKPFVEFPNGAVTVLDHIWRESDMYPAKNTNVTVPVGYSKVVEVDLTTINTSNGLNTALSYTNTINSTDIKPYKDLYIAMKMVNGTHIYLTNDGYKHYKGTDWLYLHFHQESEGVWSYTATSPDGFAAESTSTLSATTVKELLSKTYGHRADTSLHTKIYYTNLLGVIACEHVDTTTSLVDNENGTHNVVCECGTVIDTVACTYGEADLAGNQSCACGAAVASVQLVSSALVDDNYIDVATPDDVTAPDGYTTVTKYSNNTTNWTKSTKNSFSTQNISMYTEVAFAIKLSNARIMFASASGVADLKSTNWIYFNMTQDIDGTWTIKVTKTEDNGDHTVYTTATDQVSATINNHMDSTLAPADGQAYLIYPNDTSAQWYMYSTEVRVNGFRTGVPACAEAVNAHPWQKSGYVGAGRTFEELTEGAPEGYTNLIKITWSSTETSQYVYALENTIDISVYSDLYLAMKLENGERIYLQTSGVNYTGGDWLYIHLHQENSTWTFTNWDKNGFILTKGGFTGVYNSETQQTLRGLLNQMSAYATAAKGAATYYTNVLGIPKDGSTHTHSQYVSNGDGTHSSLCACGAVISTTACAGSAATCTAAGVCDTCHAEYVAALGHNKVMDENGKLYCDRDGCGETFGELDTTIEKTQDVVLFENAAYAASGATYAEAGDGFDAAAEKAITIDLSAIAGDLTITAIKDIAFNGVIYGSGTADVVNNAITINVIPAEFFGAYTLTATITVEGKTFDIEMPILAITNLIQDNAGMYAMKYILRGYMLDEEGNKIAKAAADSTQTEGSRVIYQGGKGGDGTMNGNGYYKLDNDIALTSDGGANTDVYVFGTQTVPFVGTFDGDGYSLMNYKKTNWFIDHVLEETESTDSWKKETEGSLFGVVNGTVRNVAITNVNISLSTNIVLAGTGTFEDVYFQISDLNGYSSSNIAPFFQRLDSGTAYFKNVVIDVTGAASTKGAPTWGALMESVTAYNVAVYGYNKAYTSGSTGYIYSDGKNSDVKSDGADHGVYVTYTDGTNNSARFWESAFSNELWKIVGGKLYLQKVTVTGDTSDPSDIVTEPEGSVEYNIAWNDSVVGSLEAATFIDDTTNAAFSNESWLGKGYADLTSVDGAGKLTTNQIVVGSYEDFGSYVSWTDSSQADYGVYVNGNTIFVLGETEETLMYAAQELCRQLFNWNQFMYESLDGDDAYGITVDGLKLTDTTSTNFADVVEDYTSHVAFETRGEGNTNGSVHGDLGFESNGVYTSFIAMHNATNYFGVHSYDEMYPKNASGVVYKGDYENVLVAYGFETGGNNAWSYTQEQTFATNSSGSVLMTEVVTDGNGTKGKVPVQLCYTAHGNATVFNAMVQRVYDIIVAKKELTPSMHTINFMVEDPVYSCQCSTCASLGNVSASQLLFLNALRTKMSADKAVKDVQVAFFAYNDYTEAPVLTQAQLSTLQTLAGTTFGLAEETYQTTPVSYDPYLNETTAAKAKETVMKAVDGLRVWYTTHEMNHSFEFNHRANAHRYLPLQAWIASIGAGNIDVFAYQVAFNNYFIPLNTWEYQVQYYQFLNGLGVNSHIYNLGNVANPANAQTGFSAFKTFIDSRAMRDVTVTFEELKQEFFGYKEDSNGNRTFNNSGYYGAGGEAMLTFFEELVEVMEGHKQGNANQFVDLNGKLNGTTAQTYVGTLGEDGSGYIATWIQEEANKTWYVTRQGFFNGSYLWNTAHMLFEESGAGTTPTTNIYVYGTKSQAETLRGWYDYCTTARSKVAPGSVYESRIQVESLFPEYAYLAYHSTYSFELFGTFSEATMPTTALTGGCATYQAFYEKAIGLGVVKPSEFHTFAGTHGGRDDEQKGVGNNGIFDTYLYENMWRNWGITV